MRVLLAATDESHLEILQSYLWHRGYEAEIALDGLECMAMLREFAPDVLVLDGELLWGGCDGVIEQMQDDPVFGWVPVILIADQRQRFSFVENPRVAARVQKPFRLGDLLDQVMSVSRSAPLADQRLGAR